MAGHQNLQDIFQRELSEKEKTLRRPGRFWINLLLTIVLKGGPRLMISFKPCAVWMTPVLSPEELLDDEHLKQTGFFQPCEHPSEGEIRQMSIPVRFSRTPGSIRRHAPRLDEPREEILRTLE